MPDRDVKAWAEALLAGATPGPWWVDEPRPRWIHTSAPIVIDEADWGQPEDCRRYKLVTLDDERAWSYADTRLVAAAPDLAAALVDQVGEVERLRGELQEATRLLRKDHLGDGPPVPMSQSCEFCAFLASHPSPEAQQ